MRLWKRKSKEIKKTEVGPEVPKPPVESQERPKIDPLEYLEAHRTIVIEMTRLEFNYKYELIPLKNEHERLIKVLEQAGYTTDQIEENEQAALTELFGEQKEEKKE